MQQGDIIKFGSYYQKDSYTKDPLEWRVLETITRTKYDLGMVLISKYSIASLPFDDSRIDVTWDDCSLRKWLNNDFYYDALEEEDNGYGEFEILKPKFTNDKVFLLTIDQTNELFEDEDDRLCTITKFGTNPNTFLLGGWVNWWLVDSWDSRRTAYVDQCGDALRYTWGKYDHGVGVRPVIILNKKLESSDLETTKLFQI